MKNIKGISTALCTTGISLAMALTMSFGLVGCSDSDSGASDEGSTYGSEEYLSPLGRDQRVCQLRRKRHQPRAR